MKSWESFFAELPASLTEHRVMFLDDLLAGNRGLVFWQTGTQNRIAVQLLLRKGCAVSRLQYWMPEPENTALDGLAVICGRQDPAFWEDNILVLCSYDYPGDAAFYAFVQERCGQYGLPMPASIHELSRGYALGAGKMAACRAEILQARQALDDENSRKVLADLLEAASLPYYWNMDMHAENFGIPDPHRATVLPRKPEFPPVPQGVILYALGEDFDRNVFSALPRDWFHRMLILCPGQTNRRLLRGWASEQKLHLSILPELPAPTGGDLLRQEKMFLGGTPLRPPRRTVACRGRTLDEIAARTGPVAAVLLHLDEELEPALAGAEELLARRPMLLIQGFSSLEKVWQTINRMRVMFPHAVLQLQRVCTENILQGYFLIITQK